MSESQTEINRGFPVENLLKNWEERLFEVGK